MDEEMQSKQCTNSRLGLYTYTAKINQSLYFKHNLKKNQCLFDFQIDNFKLL